MIILSEILKSVPNFSFFDQLIPPNLDLQNYGFLKINKIVDEIGLYLKEIHPIFNQITSIGERDPDFYYEGAHQVNLINKNITSIDVIISKLLMVLDSAEASDHIQFNHLLNKFEEVTDLSLEVKKHLISLKKKTDISVNYKELHAITFTPLNEEIDYCQNVLSNLIQLEESCPSVDLESSGVQEIIHKIQTPRAFNAKSISLPSFSEMEDSVYNDYLQLESRLEPLRISLQFLPSRIDGFEQVSNEFFPDMLTKVKQEFQSLNDRWNSLFDQLASFKHEKMEQKWIRVLKYLMEKISIVINSLIDEFESKANKRITKKIGESYKLCSNTITIIEKSITERILDDLELIGYFNEVLVSKWNDLNTLLIINQRLDDISNYTNNEFTGLRTLQTAKNSRSPSRVVSVTSPQKTLQNLINDDIPTGLGIDLGIDIENTNVPISIKNTNKVRNLEDEFGLLKSTKPNLLNDFKLTKKLESDDVKEIINQVEELKITKKQKPKTKSLIPTINKGYLKLNLPPIKKKISKRSKIPTLLRNRSKLSQLVFLSPNMGRVSPDYSLQLNSPIRINKRRTNNKSPTPRSQSDNLPITVRRASRTSRSSSLNLNFTSPPTNLGQTPDLTYPTSSHSSYNNSPVSYRSTSPDRPESSIGSRFDDDHLMQPLKNLKPAWK